MHHQPGRSPGGERGNEEKDERESVGLFVESRMTVVDGAWRTASYSNRLDKSAEQDAINVFIVATDYKRGRYKNAGTFPIRA